MASRVIGNVKRSNSIQLNKMIVLLETRPDIARRMQTDNSFWEVVTKVLNKLGPPVRGRGEWKKVWNDLRKGARDKLEKDGVLLPQSRHQRILNLIGDEDAKIRKPKSLSTNELELKAEDLSSSLNGDETFEETQEFEDPLEYEDETFGEAKPTDFIQSDKVKVQFEPTTLVDSSNGILETNLASAIPFATLPQSHDSVLKLLQEQNQILNEIKTIKSESLSIKREMLMLRREEIQLLRERNEYRN